MSNQIKPEKLSLHEFLVRKAAVKVMQSESIVEKVISFQHKSVNQAFKTTYEIEITGFCKFRLSQPKLKKKIKTQERIHNSLLKKLQQNPDDQEAIRGMEINDKILKELYALLKEPNDENRLQRTIGGSEEQVYSSSGPQGEDSPGTSREDCNLQSLS